MAPEEDSASKAPDKKYNSNSNKTSPTKSDNSSKQHTSVSKLNDGELKALLDEAITYKNPKDREGKSALFKDLLLEAEENERNARAASAGGSELVRYCNPSAKRHGRNRRSETSTGGGGGCSSISENVTHGGSLNNLAKEELYEIVSHANRQKKTVSARQREGGSLPCDVNVGVGGLDRSFLEEAAAKRNKQQLQQQKNKKQQREFTAIEMEEGESLLENDTLRRDYGGGGGGGGEQQRELQSTTTTTTEIVPTRIPRVPIKYTSSAVLHVGNDGDVTLSALDNAPDKSLEASNNTCSLNANYNVLISGSSIFNNRTMEDKKVDENGNALGQNAPDAKKSKKKKTQTEKNVVVTEAKYVAGHRGDIINDLDKLIEFIRGTENTGTKPKNNVNKSKLHNKNVSADEKKKKRTTTTTTSKTKTANDATNLKKSSSLDEISSKLNDDDDDDDDVALRSGKSSIDRTRERRSWGTNEPISYHQFNGSMENLESAAEFRVVTKKKKSRKRRNSNNNDSHHHHHHHRRDGVASSELLRRRRTTACSVPHSEKSNDSSDMDSVHSLPVDTKRLNQSDETDESLPISYAAIAKNPQQQQQQQQQQQKVAMKKQQQQQLKERKVPNNSLQIISSLPPDVHSVESFPTIPQPKSMVAVAAQKLVVVPTTTTTTTTTTCNNNLNLNNNNNSTSKVCRNGSKKTTNNTAIPNKTVNVVAKPTDELQQQQQQEEQPHPCLQNIQGDLQPMPPNITDVRTIEKMHFAQVHQHQQQQQNNINNCDSVERTINNNDVDGDDQRPAVVILSSGETKEVAGLVFGFEINEKLLSDDVCDTFMSRFVLPVKFNTNAYNHDKIVSFIGQAWDDVVNNETNGNVQYYSENL